MSVNYSITISKEADELIAKFGDTAGLGQAMARSMDRQNQLTVNLIHSKLSGEVLNVQSGRLIKSINRTSAVVSTSADGMAVMSQVGSNAATGGDSVVYAGIHEFGYDGDETVRAHTRKLTMCFGKPVDPPRTVEVKEFTRHMVVPERSYLRSSVQERLKDYSRDLSQTVMGFFSGRQGAGAEL